MRMNKWKIVSMESNGSYIFKHPCQCFPKAAGPVYRLLWLTVWQHNIFRSTFLQKWRISGSNHNTKSAVHLTQETVRAKTHGCHLTWRIIWRASTWNSVSHFSLAGDGNVPTLVASHQEKRGLHETTQTVSRVSCLLQLFMIWKSKYCWQSEYSDSVLKAADESTID